MSKEVTLLTHLHIYLLTYRLTGTDCEQKELRDEDRRYRDYLKQVRAEERAQELEMERVCDDEVEKMWERRVRQWKAEKMARQKLLDEVIAARRQQIQHRRTPRFMFISRRRALAYQRG